MTLSSIYTHSNTLKTKKKKKKNVEKGKIVESEQFHLFVHNFFYAICILKCINSHISVVACNFFEFGMVSKWCIREWVKCFDETDPWAHVASPYFRMMLFTANASK